MSVTLKLQRIGCGGSHLFQFNSPIRLIQKLDESLSMSVVYYHKFNQVVTSTIVVYQLYLCLACNMASGPW